MLAFPSLNSPGQSCRVCPPRPGPDIGQGRRQEARSGHATLSSATVSLSYSTSGNRSFLTNGVQKYQAVAGLEVKPTVAASNILNFIENRLALDLAEGASREELQSRLRAGVDGFFQGYDEAMEQLKAGGALPDAVAEATGNTYRDVMLGINRLAAELGLESPFTSDSGNPADENKPTGPSMRDHQASYREDGYSSRSFSFQVKTQEGDVVTIRANAEQAGNFSFTSVENQTGQNAYEYQGISAQFHNASQFAFSVEGELDEGELKAINQLLNQVNSLSETFFSGDIQAAYQQALQTGFNSDEIAQFSLTLKMTDFSRVNSAYSSGSGRGEAIQPRVAQLADFVRQIEEARLRAQQFGIDLLSLAGFIADSRHANRVEHDAFNPVIAGILNSLDRLNAYSKIRAFLRKP